MEDLNMLAADCVVVCCCCQCLVLQILALIFLRLPCELARKSKKFARKKFGKRRRMEERRERKDSFRSDSLEILTGDTILAVFCDDHKCAIEEAQKVMKELSSEGEFVFGSFWGRNGSATSRTCDDIIVSNIDLIMV